VLEKAYIYGGHRFFGVCAGVPRPPDSGGVRQRRRDEGPRATLFITLTASQAGVGVHPSL